MTSDPEFSQAVILCGGLGTRLRPLTNSLPKPMVPVHSKPFLYHLLKQLSEQGISRFLLLTGFMSETISDYFGNGARYGWSISYSQGPTDWDTGRRLWEAREQYEPRFLLLYSDNFVQFNLIKLGQLHRKLGCPITLHLAPKNKGNIKASQDGKILAYDKDRTGDGFDYVEVGYMAVERDRVFGDFPLFDGFPNISFAKVLQRYAMTQQIGGIVVRDPYHSISDPKRLALMCEYLKPKRILLLDRDGTINEKAEQGQYIATWSQFRWIAKTREALEKLAEDGFQFIVATNQAGIARKMIDPDALEHIHLNMTSQLAQEGISILKVYVSPHHWDENSFMRKPAPGLFFKAAEDFNLRMDRVLYVGDDQRDCIAASNAGCGMVHLDETMVQTTLNEFPNPYLSVSCLTSAVPWIRSKYNEWKIL